MKTSNREKTLKAPFTAKAVEAWNEVGTFCDRDGLYLQVSLRKSEVGVSKSWVFRYRDLATSKLRELGLGSLTKVTLGEAREAAAKNRSLLNAGKDPKAEREKARMELAEEASRRLTFDQAAAKYIADNRAGWKNEKHAAQWESTLATYATPVIGKLPVDAIELFHIRKILDPIWVSKNETASRVRQRIESILDWSKVNGYRKGENPARWRGHLSYLLPKPSKVQKKKHHAALPYEEVGAFVAELRSKAGLGAVALEFLILTAVRTTEVRGARWEEFNLQKRTWTIPAERMKAEKEHVVPLSGRAFQLIEKLKETPLGPLVFPGDKSGAPISNGTMDRVLKRMGRKGAGGITVHGFRSTFRDWAGETSAFPERIIEHALAHQLKDKAEAAYARGTMLEKRRQLMEAWAKYCDTTEVHAGNVIPIRAAL